MYLLNKQASSFFKYFILSIPGLIKDCSLTYFHDRTHDWNSRYDRELLSSLLKQYETQDKPTDPDCPFYATPLAARIYIHCACGFHPK